MMVCMQFEYRLVFVLCQPVDQVLPSARISIAPRLGVADTAFFKKMNIFIE